MIDLTIYGIPSSTYEFAKTEVLKNISNAGVEINTKEVSNHRQFFTDLISGTPAFKIGEEVKILKNQDIHEFIQEVSIWILKKENFGNMKKIIVPIDFSEASMNAVHYGEQLAHQLNGVLQLVHVYHPVPVMAGEVSYIDPKIEEIQKKRLQDFTKNYQTKLAEHQFKKVMLDSLFKYGFPSDVLIELSETEENTIIVMGSKGDNPGAMKKWFGSVSTKVAQGSSCPVIIIPPNASYTPIEKIAYCTGSVLLDATAVHKVVGIAKPYNADINLVHVGLDEVWDAKELLHLWSNFYPKKKVHYEQLNGGGVVERINDFCTSKSIDMVAISTKERSFFDDLFHKSITKAMAIHTTIPLLITHSRDMDFND